MNEPVDDGSAINQIESNQSTMIAIASTPLHLCTVNPSDNHIAGVKALLEVASLRYRDFNGNSPLHVAAAAGNEAAIQVCIRVYVCACVLLARLLGCECSHVRRMMQYSCSLQKTHT